MQREETRKRYPDREEIPELETANFDVWDNIDEPEMSGRASRQSGQYRETLKAKEKGPSLLSHIPSVVLVIFVCLMGVISIQNQQKMDQMQEAMNQNQANVDGDQSANANDVNIEPVSGNVQPENNQPAEPPKADEQEDAEDTEDAAPETEPSEMVVDENPVDEPPVVPEPVQSGNVNNLSDEAKISLERGYYIVQRGDSLISICMKIYLTTDMMEQLCAANGIEDKDAIYAGQILTLP